MGGSSFFLDLEPAEKGILGFPLWLPFCNQRKGGSIKKGHAAMPGSCPGPASAELDTKQPQVHLLAHDASGLSTRGKVHSEQAGGVLV